MRRLVAAGGGCVSLEDSGGHGHPVIFLHAGWGDSTIWDGTLDILSPAIRSIKFDTQGYGDSPPPSAEFTALEEVMDVLDELSIAKAIIVGHSGGGATALELALHAPSLVESLILVAPGVSGYPWPEDDDFLQEFGPLLRTGDAPGLIELGLRTWAAADQGANARRQIQAGVMGMLAQGHMSLTNPPIIERLGQIQSPSDVLVGSLDHPALIATAEFIAQTIPNCTTTVLHGADHMLPAAKPSVVAALVHKHVALAAAPSP